MLPFVFLSTFLFELVNQSYTCSEFKTKHKNRFLTAIKPDYCMIKFIESIQHINIVLNKEVKKVNQVSFWSSCSAMAAAAILTVMNGGKKLYINTHMHKETECRAKNANVWQYNDSKALHVWWQKKV